MFLHPGFTQLRKLLKLFPDAQTNSGSGITVHCTHISRSSLIHHYIISTWFNTRALYNNFSGFYWYKLQKSVFWQYISSWSYFLLGDSPHCLWGPEFHYWSRKMRGNGSKSWGSKVFRKETISGKVITGFSGKGDWPQREEEGLLLTASKAQLDWAKSSTLLESAHLFPNFSGFHSFPLMLCDIRHPKGCELNVLSFNTSTDFGFASLFLKNKGILIIYNKFSKMLICSQPKS